MPTFRFPGRDFIKPLLDSTVIELLLLLLYIVLQTGVWLNGYLNTYYYDVGPVFRAFGVLIYFVIRNMCRTWLG